MIYNLPDHERAVIYTLGRLTGVKGPGMVFVIPVLHTMQRVDMRSAVAEVPNATVTFHITDAEKALTEVADYRGAMKQLSESTLARELSGRSKDALIFERKGIEDTALKAMNAIAGAWGIHVDKVELKR